MQRFATLDVGSNSVLLLVADLHPDGVFRAVLDRAEITRLGDGLANGRLAAAAMDRTVDAIAEMVRQARELGASEIAAVGTEALRQAVNAPELLGRLERELALPLRVIGGEEEARLSFVAARAGLPLEPGKLVVLDVGGGSTELILGTSERMERRTSLPLGALSLTRTHLVSDPVRPEEMKQAEERLGQALDQQALTPVEQVIGIGGAVTTLCAVQLGLEPYDPEQTHGARLSLAEVRRQIALYAGMTVAERRRLPGLHPQRADTILAGGLIVRALMERLGARFLTISDRGLRHGLMEDRFGL